MLKKISIYIVCFCVLGAGLVSANRYQKSLEDFFERHNNYIQNQIPFTSHEYGEIFDAQKKIGIFEDILQRLALKQEEDESILTPFLYKKQKLLDIVTELDDELIEHRANIRRASRGVRRKQQNIESATKELAELRNTINQQKKILRKYFQYFYIASSSIYDNESIDLLKGVLLADNNAGETISDLYFTQHMQIKSGELLAEHQELVASMLEKKQHLREQKHQELSYLSSLKVLRDELQEKINNKQIVLDTITSKTDQLLADTENNENVEDIFKDKITRLKEDIEKSFIDAKDSYCQEDIESTQCEDFLSYYAAEKFLRDEGDGFDADWPVQPKEGISSYFKDASYRKQFGVFHYAIDVPVEQGTNVAAISDGYVVFVAPPTNDSYSYIILKHNDWYLSVYGHMSHTRVELFQFVKQWQIIGKSWWEEGEHGSGFMTTGPHLHFELWKDKKPVDPLYQLSTAHIPYKFLSNKYVYKYVDDFHFRYGRELSLDWLNSKKDFLYFDGITEAKRQEQFLDRYAVESFNTPLVWRREAVKEGIDPSFIMCIGFAETTLGKYMKTKNNIGNVGNTDSGSTYEFDTPKQGIRWIAATFNNPFLGEYTTLDQLSRWGNDDGIIYASAPINWHNNIMKCLSALKGYQVENDFEFRIQ